MKVKRVMYSIITTVLLLMGISSTVFADEDAKDVENTDFTVTMETGLDNVAVEGEAMPVTVTVGNTGKDFVGYLRVIIPASYSVDSLAYEKAVTIPSGGEKSISMLLPNVDEAAFLRIELETERGKILYSQQETFKSTTTGQNAVIGILSSDYSGLNYFDGISVDLGYGAISTKVLRLTEDNIPDTGKGLSVCDYILIDNYNTSQLSEEQRNAIASWVSDGGILRNRFKGIDYAGRICRYGSGSDDRWAYKTEFVCNGKYRRSTAGGCCRTDGRRLGGCTKQYCIRRHCMEEQLWKRKHSGTEL